MELILGVMGLFCYCNGIG